MRHAWTRTERLRTPPPSINKCVRDICQRAGVLMICRHSLRGLNARLKLQAGASADYVARRICHTSFGITLRHSVDPAVKAAVDARRVDLARSRVGGRQSPIRSLRVPQSPFR